MGEVDRGKRRCAWDDGKTFPVRFLLPSIQPPNSLHGQARKRLLQKREPGGFAPLCQLLHSDPLLLRKRCDLQNNSVEKHGGEFAKHAVHRRKNDFAGNMFLKPGPNEDESCR